MLPSRTTSGLASGGSISCSGRAIVIMPSCTMPISSNRSVICTAIWRDMLVSCSVSGSTMAMAPTSTMPFCHSKIAIAPAPAISSALSRFRIVPNIVSSRCAARNTSTWRSTASRT